MRMAVGTKKNNFTDFHNLLNTLLYYIIAMAHYVTRENNNNNKN